MAVKDQKAAVARTRAALTATGARLRQACKSGVSACAQAGGEARERLHGVCCGRAAIMRGARPAACLLPHVSLLLVLIGGAALGTAARLKWDPSAYVPVRQMFPAEYRVASGALAAGGAVLLMLAHLAAAALSLHPSRARRVLLILYAVGTLVLCAAEVCVAGWLGARLAAWLRSTEGQQLADALELRRHLSRVLDYLGRWHPLPKHLKGLLEEVEADVPANVYAGAGVALVLGALQAAAALLALLAASAPLTPRPDPSAHRAARRRSLSWTSAGTAESARSAGSRAADTAPLRAKYKNGRLVIV